MIQNSQRPYIVWVGDMTSYRSLNTDYTNTSGRTMFVTVSARLDIVNIGDIASLVGFVDAVVTQSLQNRLATTGYVDMSMTMIVPPSSTYKANYAVFGTAEVTMLRWMEAY